MSEPLYKSLLESGWREKLEQLRELFSPCMFCPRLCGAMRADDEPGECGSGLHASAGSHNLHFGEEPPVSGTRGSGTVFFSGCNLHCLFCQNYPLSQMRHGEAVTAEKLAGMYLELQRRGAHNLNLVTPSHVNLQWFEALFIAAQNGFSLPVVYNCGGYDRVEVLRIFEGVIDVYMPDAKYRDAKLAAELSDAKDYPKVNQAALIEMHRQAGPLVTDAAGIAVRGMLVRHLMLPGKLENTLAVLDDIAAISPDIPVSLMTQYFPAYKAPDTPGMNERVTKAEYRAAEKRCRELGLINGYFQRL